MIPTYTTPVDLPKICLAFDWLTQMKIPRTAPAYFQDLLPCLARSPWTNLWRWLEQVFCHSCCTTNAVEILMEAQKTGFNETSLMILSFLTTKWLQRKGMSLFHTSTQCIPLIQLNAEQLQYYCSVLFFSRSMLTTPWTYFLHLSLSSVILIDSSTGSPVHVLMLSIQAVRGLPQLRAPDIVPCSISFSSQLPCFLMVWP